MKKKLLAMLLTSCLACTILLSGCSDNSAGNYVGEKITSLKGTDTASFTPLLEAGIKDSNEQFVLQFPEELRDTYLQFLQDAFSSVSFEASAAKKKDSTHYAVDLTFSPIDLGKTVEASDEDYLAQMTNTDFLTDMKELLKEDAAVLKEAPVYKDSVNMTIDIRKKDDGYTISEKTIHALLKASVKNYMTPYNNACEVLDTRDFFQSYLDASFKGEFTQFTKHTQKTAEEAQAWYDASFSDVPAELSDEQKGRYMNALKSIMKQCKYELQIPRKNDGIFDYSIDVTYSPNNSLVEAMNALKSGTYYSVYEATDAAIQLLETHVATPVFGTETTTTVNLNFNTLMTSGEPDSEMAALIDAICPTP